MEYMETWDMMVTFFYMKGTDSKKFPTVVQFSKEKQCIMAACGAKHMLAVTKDKILYSWGNGANGR
jgi:alpha-tubulin suppressor-like RCC1 family protein